MKKVDLDALSLDEFIDYVDEHDIGDELARRPEVEMEASIQKRSYAVTLDEDLYDQVAKIAKSHHTSAGSLIQSWLQEKVTQAR